MCLSSSTWPVLICMYNQFFPCIILLSLQLLNNASVNVAALSEDLLTVVQSGTLLPGDIPYISDIILKAASFAHNITSVETIQVKQNIRNNPSAWCTFIGNHRECQSITE